MSTVSEIEFAKDGLIQVIEEIFPDTEILIDPVLSADLRIRILNTLYSPTLDKNRRTNPIMFTFGSIKQTNAHQGLFGDHAELPAPTRVQCSS